MKLHRKGFLFWILVGLAFNWGCSSVDVVRVASSGIHVDNQTPNLITTNCTSSGLYLMPREGKKRLVAVTAVRHRTQSLSVRGGDSGLILPLDSTIIDLLPGGTYRLVYCLAGGEPQSVEFRLHRDPSSSPTVLLAERELVKLNLTTSGLARVLAQRPDLQQLAIEKGLVGNIAILSSKLPVCDISIDLTGIGRGAWYASRLQNFIRAINEAWAEAPYLTPGHLNSIGLFWRVVSMENWNKLIRQNQDIAATILTDVTSGVYGPDLTTANCTDLFNGSFVDCDIRKAQLRSLIDSIGIEVEQRQSEWKIKWVASPWLRHEAFPPPDVVPL